MINLKANQYVDLVRRSGLVDEPRLSHLLSNFPDLDSTDSGIIRSTLIETGVLTDWQSSLLMAGKYKGFFLGKYKLLGQLGKGGMGAVYLAEHTVLKRRVAIKVLKKELVGMTSFLERFYQEAQAAATLDHPNIVRCYDADQADGTSYFAMEYIDGESLQSIVESRGPLEYRLAAEYIRQAALGLEHAHKTGIVHRDVKPANVLVDGAGTVKVVDLGLARVHDDTRASLTVAYDERMIGTIDYLAPEQAVDCHAVDARADLYSLGCTLYFLLTGNAPFNTGTMAQRVMKHQTAEPPSIRAARPDVPEALVGICKHMMAKSPRDRCQSAADAAHALAAWLEPPSARIPVPLRERTGPPSTAGVLMRIEEEIGLAPEREEPAPPRARAAARTVAAPAVEVNLTETTGAPGLGGMGDLLDEVLREAPKFATPLDQSNSWEEAAESLPEHSRRTAPRAAPWSSSADATSRPPAEIGAPLWLLIGAGVLLGAIVLGVAYSAISSFTTERPPATIEYKSVD